MVGRPTAPILPLPVQVVIVSAIGTGVGTAHIARTVTAGIGTGAKPHFQCFLFAGLGFEHINFLMRSTVVVFHGWSSRGVCHFFFPEHR